MIAYLEGRVIERRGAELVVKVIAGGTSQGVGYSVIAGGPGFLDVAEEDLVAVWIHSITKETGTTLYGFSTRGARDQFVELLGVDGVGPKIAMAIVNAGANPRELSSLVGIKGVGAKTAAKIVEQLGAAA